MATRMQQRRGTAAQWTSANPILAAGEIGFESDTNQFKIGDGIDHWDDLSYFKNLEDLGGSLDDYILLTARGSASGVAALDASSNILAPASIVFEGATDNAYETTVEVVDPTADRTITFPNATGIVVLSDSSGNVTIPGNFTVSGTTTTVDSTVINIQNEIKFEGTTGNDFETSLVAEDPTADRTITLPNLTGTVVLDAGAQTLYSKSINLNSNTLNGTVAEFNTALSDGNFATTAGTETLTNKTLTSPKINEDVVLTATATELNYVDGVTSSIQTQLDAKQPIITGVSNTELGYLDGVTSAIQTQIDAKLDSVSASTTYQTRVVNVSDTEISYLDGVTSAIQTQINDKAPKADPTFTGTVTLPSGTVTSGMIANDTIVNADINTAAAIDWTKLAVSSTVSSTELGYLDGVTSSVQTQLDGKQATVANVSDVEIGYLDGVTSSIQTQLDAKSTASKTETLTNKTLTSPVINTPTGITKSDVGLANVDNTTDANKPVSTATQTALDLKAALAGPTFTGTVVLPSTTSIGNVSATEIGYVDGVTSSIQTQLDAKLSKAGGTMTGALTLSGAPTSDLHAATKLYVDNVTAGINFHESVHAASVTNLATIYNNGTSGVGATLTADTNRAFATLDGESVVLGQRVLIKNQTDAKQNGIYTLTTVGSVSAPWVLTRATDADNNPTGEMKTGDFTFVQNGTVNASVGYINNSTANPIVIGTDNITYTEFNAGKTVVAGDGLTEATPGTISVATGGITSAMIADGTIVDGDINASAAIAQSKISGLTSDLAAKAPLASPTFTGTVTVAASGIAFTDGTQTLEGVPSRTPIIQKTASYTLSALTERDDLIEMGSASAITLSIPTDATLNFPIGTSIDILQTGAGQVTIAAVTPGTTTVNATPGLKLRTQWSSATLFKRAANTWVVFGDLTA